MLSPRIPYLALLIAASAGLVAGDLSPEAGSFLSRGYPAKSYGASPQNFAFAQDDHGLIYVANADGLLVFDGVKWRLTRLRNGSVVRSVAVDKGTAYYGGQREFGFLEPDPSGVARPKSLIDRLKPADRDFGDVWRVLPTRDGIYFSSYFRLFRLNPDGSVAVWRPNSNFGRAILVGGSVYVKTKERGLLTVKGTDLVPAPGGERFAKIAVRDAVQYGGDGLICSENRLFLMRASGIEDFATSADPYFAKNVIHSLAILPGDEIAVGTEKGGLVLLNRSGRLDRIITYEEGSRDSVLADNYVVSIFPDRQGGVWLAYDQGGITRFVPGLTRFDKQMGLPNATMAVRSHSRLYVGSHAGLFRLTDGPGVPPKFSAISNAPSKVWAAIPNGNGVIAATNRGVYSVADDIASPIFNTRQDVFDVTIPADDPESLYAAGKNLVLAFQRQGTAWRKTAEVSLLGNEIWSIVPDSGGKVWATAADKIWRIDFEPRPPKVQTFGASRGVPGGGQIIFAHRLGDHVAFATGKGLVRFSEGMNRFAPDTSLGLEYADGSRNVFHVFPDRVGNVWVTGTRYHDLLLREANGYKKLPSPLLQSGIDEIWSMSLDDDGTAWASGADGILYRYQRDISGNPDVGFNVLTRMIHGSDEQAILYGGFGPPPTLRLPYRSNALRFEFAAPFFEDPAAVEYQAYLEGSDRNWSQWTHEPGKDYNNLREDSYTLRIRARSPHGASAENSSFTFAVLPPWYRTWWAYSLYAVFGCFGVWGIVRWRVRQLEEDKRQLENTVAERTVEIRQQRDEIHAQERKGHALLLNILPEKVADELKTTGAVQPVGFDDVTVCFTDFVGFTLSSEKLPPDHLVNALNEYFTAFDEIVARYGLEKMKTIGDAYMFASGLPTRRASHAVDAVLAALEMAEVVRRLARKSGGTGWNIRIGLHSGPVVAGVVGIKKFAFDIWGNTVNFAARMESSGVPGRVNMSERTCRLTRELIECEFRGQVKIKEGRELPMYLAHAPVADFEQRYVKEFGEAPRTMLKPVEMEAASTV